MKRTKSFRASKKDQDVALAEAEKLLAEIKEGIKTLQEGSFLHTQAKIEIKRMEHSINMARRRAPP